MMLFLQRQLPVSQHSNTCRTVPGSLNTGLVHLNYHVWAAIPYTAAKAYKTTDDLTGALATISEELSHNHIKAIHLYLIINKLVFSELPTSLSEGYARN